MDEKWIIEQVDLLPQTDQKNEHHILAARRKNKRSYMIWEEPEDHLLSLLYVHTDYKIDKIAIFLKRSSGGVESRVTALNLNREDKLKENQPTPTSIVEKKSSNAVQNIIHYWRTSLADADKMGIDVKKMADGKRVTLNDIEKGQLLPQYIEPFFKAAEQTIKEKNKDNIKYKKALLEETINQLSVIIAPITAKKMFQHGHEMKATDHSPSTFFPLWLTATLTRDGRLKPSEERTFPWIERRCLTPNEQKYTYPIIGDVSQVDEYYTLHNEILDDKEFNWQSLFSFGMELYLKILNSHKKNIFQDQNYITDNTGYILPYSDMQGSSQYIIKTYDQYLTNTKKNISNLFREFCTLDKRETTQDKVPADLFLLNKCHIGQMQADHPLSSSQRASINYLYDEPNNDIFTVHGPPGTGKTTLLLSVIASKWIQAAIDNQPPPIIVAASTNNLAVTNILDSFNKINSSERWLPELTSYGLYLAPSQKIEAATKSGYLYQTRDGTSTISNFYTNEYVKKAENIFLAKFNLKYSKVETSIKTAKNHLHNLMLEKHQLLINAIFFSHTVSQELTEIINQYGNLEIINN
ncbi:MAG: hypothetical protein HKM04_04495, partial [Legionellales bacterium]|nr:hypothetical protein [Legionellales bacterium]